MSSRTKKNRTNFSILPKNFARLIIDKLRSFNEKIPLHVTLFAVFPVLFIYSTNIDEVFLEETFLPITTILVITLGAFFLTRFILKDPFKAGIITTIALIIFFSYGHVFESIEGLKIFGFQIGRNKFLLPSAFVIFIALSTLTWRSKKNQKPVSNFLNIMAVVLVSISLINIGSYAIQNGIRISETKPVINTVIDKKSVNTPNKPDIYYIILDGYARASTLEKVYGFDNSNFINNLKNKGFYVADKSKSNYSITHLSLASSLNMNYLTNVANSSKSETEKRRRVNEIIRSSEVSKVLKSRGYTYINIGSGWGTTSKNPYADLVFYRQGRSEFTKILFQTSLLVIAEPVQSGDAESILAAFEKLSEIPELKSPTFTFAHIVSPHPPYLFDRDGNQRSVYFQRLGKLDSWREKNKYIDQLIFINKKTRQVVEDILMKSTIPPIIIIQGDHGTALNTDLGSVTKENLAERMDILNAYYLPMGGNKILYENITPVNSFRKVFNYYFGTDYEYLDDLSYYSVYGKDFEFLTKPSKK